jgi:DNA repair protein RadC
MKVNSEPLISYQVEDPDAVIARALAILASRVKARPVVDSPGVVKDYLRLALAHLEHEVFGILFLDNHMGVIEDEVMFRGTLNQTSVYPREVVKAAIKHNASAVLLYHNHPSGKAEPSRADEHLTSGLRQALTLVDVKVLDHLVVTNTDVVSFAERGLL